MLIRNFYEIFIFRSSLALVLCVFISACATPTAYQDEPDPLDGISVPPDWQLISDYDTYDLALKASGATIDLPPPSNCRQDIVAFARPKLNFIDSTCLRIFWKRRGIKDIRNQAADVFLELAKRDEINFYSESEIHYTYFDTIMFIASFYAVESPRLNYSANDRSLFEDWLKRKVGPSVSLNPQNRLPCTARTKKRLQIDDCGSSRQRYTQMLLLIGLSTGDQAIFDRGIHSLKYLHQFIDNKGVYIGMAWRGGLAAHYHAQMSDAYSIYAEILDTLGVDYLAYRVPSGLTIAEATKFSLSIFDGNIKPLLKYAKMEIGNKGYKSNLLKQGSPPLMKPKENRLRFAARYMDSFEPESVYQADWDDHGQYYFDSYSVYIANVVGISENDVQKINDKRPPGCSDPLFAEMLSEICD